MKRLKKLLVLTFVLSLLFGSVTANVKAEDGYLQDGVNENYDYNFEDEEEAARKAQEAALEAAAAEAAKRAAEQVQQYQQEIDYQTQQSNSGVWQTIDEVIEPENGKKNTSAPTTASKTDEEKEEVVADTYVRKEMSASVELGGDSSINVTTKYGALPEGTSLSVRELGDDALLEFANRVGLENVVDGRYFVVNLVDENNEVVTPSKPLTISLNQVDVTGELVNIYAANSETYETYAEGLENSGTVNHVFETKDFDTFVILATGTTEVEEEPVTGIKSFLQKFNIFSSLTNTEEETTLSGRTETEFTNGFESSEKKIELDTESNPAFTESKAIAGTNMQIVVDAPAGAFPEGIKLFAEVVATPAEVLQAIEEKTGAPATETLSIDVHFYLDEDPNTEIEPIIPISVTFNNIDIDAKLVDVYHEDEKIDTISSDGGTLELDGFSTYTFTPTPIDGDVADTKIHFVVNIKFDDDFNRDGKRRSVRIDLVGSDGQTKSLTADPVSQPADDSQNTNSLDFGNDLRKYSQSDNSLVKWSLTPSDLEGYTYSEPKFTQAENSNEVTVDITYTHVPERVTLNVTNVWDDNNNIDNKRPEKLYFVVFRDGEYVRLREVNKTTTTISEHPDKPDKAFYKYKNFGQLVSYTVQESLTGGGVVTPIGNGYTLTEVHDAQNYTYKFTNTRAQDTREIKVQKVWEGEEGDTSKRPENVIVNLLADGVPVNTPPISLTETNGWKDSFINQPVNKQDPSGKGGVEIEYTIQEVEVPFYVSEITGDMDSEEGFKITNTLIPNKTTVTIEKEWVDEGKHPDGVHISLRKNGVTIKETDLHEADDWTITFNDIQVYENPTNAETLIDYKVEEENVDGFVTRVEKSGDPVQGYTYTVINTLESIAHERIDVDASIIWDDGNDADGYRPDSVVVRLLADEVDTGKTLTLSKSNEYSGTFTELDKFDFSSEEPKEIEYSVEADDIDEYTKEETTGDMESGFVLGYSRETEKITITVNKNWMDEDANDRDGVRPDQITYILLADGEEIDRKTVDVEEDGSAPYAWIADKNNGGNEIVYRVIEDDVYPYYPKYEVEETEEEGIAVTITNTYDPEKRTITVVKNWDDNDDQDGIRPETVTVKLIANDDKDNPVDTAELSKENGWAHNFVVWTNEDGQPIKYTVEEEELTGKAKYKYETTYSDFADSGYITVTNTHVPDTGIVILEKEWNDEDNLDGSRPESIIFNIEGFIVDFDTKLKIHIPYDQTIVMRATSEMPEKTDEGQNDVWVKTVELPKFYKGERITYWLTEEVVEGYESDKDVITIQMPDDYAIDEYRFVNTHEPQPVTIEGNVIWRDSDNQDGIRPEKVTINLYADGELIETLEVTGDPTENTWPYKFEDLPKYSKGNVINYTVSEGAIDNYTMRQQGYDFYNSYTPGKTFLTVIKLWDDDRNRDGLRPDNCIIRLLADGKEINRATVSEGTGWFTVFSNLDINKEGKEITYTVEEDKVDKYTTEITGNQKDGFVIKNSHKPETVNVNIKVKWYDDDNKCDKRPGNVIGYLQANGITVDAKWLLPANNWEATIENLPKYAYGKEIVYTISLKALEDYDTVIVGTRAYNYIKGCCGKDPCKLCKDCKPNLPKTGVE